MPEFIAVSAATPEGVATLTLNRPEKRNALSIALRDEVAAALAELAGDDSVKVVVLTGAGQSFSAGFDLREFQAAAGDDGLARALWHSSDRYHRALIDFPLPLVAAVNGQALAGGFDLAILCDIRVASTTATFAHPEVTFGDVVYSPLHDLVGGAVARELCLTGRHVDAHEALGLRLVSAVVQPEGLLDEAYRWASMVAQAPRHLLLRTKAKIIDRARVHATATLDL